MRLIRVLTYCLVVLMLLPIVVTSTLAFTSGSTVAFPPPGYSIKWLVAVFADNQLGQAALLSTGLAVAVALLSVAISLPSCFMVERHLTSARQSLETAVMMPRMVPEIVLVLALLIFFERIRLAETLTGLLVSHLIICVPFTYRTLAGSVAGLDRRLEWSSDILGAAPMRRFWRVVLPQLKTAIVSACAFTFILSFNNVTMALLLSGAQNRTLPVEMFVRMNIGGLTPVVPALSLVLAVGGTAIFILMDRTVGAFSKLSGR